MAGQMDCCGITDMGRKRPSNEDQFLIADLNKSMRVHQTSLGLDHQTRLFGNSQGKLLGVADGMGGHEGGERASQLVVDSVVTYILNTLNWFWRLDAQGDEEFRDELKSALQHCQAVLQRDVEATPQRSGMGSTLTLAYVIWPRMYIVHVGDSRCYLLRDGNLRQMTRDHTLSQLHKEAAGEAKENEETDDDSPGMSNVLWNVIGASDHEVFPEVYGANLELGDVMLLCTDGLTKHVGRPRLRELLESDSPVEDICQQLVDAANEQGGSDNITVVVSRFREEAKEHAKEAHAELPLEEGKPDPFADTDPHMSIGKSLLT